MTPEQQLRDATLRVTGPRLAVLTELSAHPHSDVETLAARVRSRLGSVSTQVVYDVLRALADAGLVRRIEPARSPARFETRVNDNHPDKMLLGRTFGYADAHRNQIGDPACRGHSPAKRDKGVRLDEW